MSAIAIIGGGMSGLVCAISAAENNTNKVTVYERQDKPGKKILSTGNGRCNICNTEVNNVLKYSSSEEPLLKKYMENFDYRELVDFYKGLGLKLINRDGYLYPFSNQAKSVLSCLIEAATERGVVFKTGLYIDDIDYQAGKWIINNQHYDKCVLALGGRAGVYKENAFCGRELIKKLNIKSSYTSPALTGLITKENVIDLKGIRCEASCTLSSNDREIASETGELQFTDYGLSGIPIFCLTNHIPYERSNLVVKVNILPGENFESARSEISRLFKMFPERTVRGALAGLIHDGLNEYVIKVNGISPDTKSKDLSLADIDKLAQSYIELRFNVEKLRDYKNAQVMKGGILLSETDGHYAIKNYNGLYAIGEMLDITGDCGGYNLYFAFKSGRIVGLNL